MTDCLKCANYTKVTDSRPSPGKNSIKRRRLCVICGYRFWTFEISATQLDRYTELEECLKQLNNFMRTI